MEEDAGRSLIIGMFGATAWEQGQPYLERCSPCMHSIGLTDTQVSYCTRKPIRQTEDSCVLEDTARCLFVKRKQEYILLNNSYLEEVYE